MKIGLLSSILADYTFEQVIDFVSEKGLACAELACWPKGKAQRRYAGVTHIDVDGLDDENDLHPKIGQGKKSDFEHVWIEVKDWLKLEKNLV